MGIVDNLDLLHRCCSVLILADQLGPLRYHWAAAVLQKHVEYRMPPHCETRTASFQLQWDFDRPDSYLKATSRKLCSELHDVAQKTVDEGGRYIVL